LPNPTPHRIAAINFLNPAPLMWDFEHPPLDSTLATRYTVEYTQPALCAHKLLTGAADLGLIPIAALTPALAVVPGCAIAALDHVRSILLLIKHPHTLATIRTVAVDTASRSSVAYLQVILRRFHANQPALLPLPADPVAMLSNADAALLIGDPALLARERQSSIEAATGPLLWLDLAHEWHTHTGLPWVAAVWAARPEALSPQALNPQAPSPEAPDPEAPSAQTTSAAQLAQDLQLSRDHGLAHIKDLVREWSPRIALPADTIRRYLTQNIHYHLDDPCLRAIQVFRQYAAEAGILPPLGPLRLLWP